MIVDASVAFKWLVAEEGSGAAIDLLAEENLAAPTWLLVEVSNALWKRIARGEMNDPEGAAEQVARLPELLSLTDEHVLIGRAMAIACEIGHPIYDCLYLAMAENRDEPLVTADRRLLEKVKSTRFEQMVRALDGE